MSKQRPIIAEQPSPAEVNRILKGVLAHYDANLTLDPDSLGWPAQLHCNLLTVSLGGLAGAISDDNRQQIRRAAQDVAARALAILIGLDHGAEDE